MVVAFSATRVYELAERLRRKRGGAAVVIGALSPRARNAQVALFQSGEVDTLVATDAIGMGLNLDVDHVVFAELRKFDGRQARPLEDAELAQIAGRAGRHMRDGRFATLDPLPPLPPPTVRALERHRFPPDEQVFWRNSDLDLASVDSLLASLKQRPRQPLVAAGRRRPRSAGGGGAGPDARGAGAGHGPRTPAAVTGRSARSPTSASCRSTITSSCRRRSFSQLCTRRPPGARLGRRPAAAAGAHRGRSGDAAGPHVGGADLDVRHRANASGSTRPPAWQTRTHDLEDRLSDALHQQLVQRFVDATGARAGAGAGPARTAAGAGAALTGGRAGRQGVGGHAGRGAHTPAADAWVEPLIDAPHEAFAVDGEGRLSAGGRPLGRLVRGSDRLHPEVNLTAPLGAGARLRLGRRMLAFARDLVAGLLQPLELPDADRLGPAARGLLYQLQQSLGSVAVTSVRDQLAALSPGDRRRLREAGLVLGPLALYHPGLMTPAALQQRRALCAAERWPDPLPVPDAENPGTLPARPEVPARVYEPLGYVLQGRRAIRADQRPGPGRGTGARRPRRRG